jgi:hypothetical protein
MYICLRVNYPSFLSHFKETRIFSKYSKNTKMKYHENPSSGSRVVPWGQTDKHGKANSRFSQYCGRALVGYR